MKILRYSLIIVLLILLGLYLWPVNPVPFEENYKKNDRFSRTLKEFRLRPVKNIDVDGVFWPYYTGGKGDRAILFLHGMGGAYDLWWNQIVAFEDQFRVITYSLPEEVNSLEKTLDGLLAILEKEQVKKVILVGTSMGGYIAQYFISQRPEMVERAVLSNTFPPNDLYTKEKGGLRKILPWIPEVIITKFGEKQLKEKLLPAAHNDSLLAAFLPSLPFSIKQFTGRYDIVVDFFESAPADYQYKRIPKLIIESDNDPLIPPVLRKAIKKRYPEALVYTFHNEGHFPYINAVDEYNTVLSEFFGREDDYQAVETTLSAYFSGRRKADTALLKVAFADFARLNGVMEGMPVSIRLEKYLGKVAADGPLTIETSILNGDITDNIASFSTLFEYSDKTYIDHLSLVKAGGKWQIVNKTFTKLKDNDHTNLEGAFPIQ